MLNSMKVGLTVGMLVLFPNASYEQMDKKSVECLFSYNMHLPVFLSPPMFL